MIRNDCLAMLLAGGQGSRLGVLTKQLAKPAVPFGGKYRIIDFSLSNCTNSGISTVGVLTQYHPLILNAHIGNGNSWDLDHKDAGLSLLPPYVDTGGGHWYKGTADAVYQNLYFINTYNPDYVLVLSGDHIYKMDYGLMLDFHRQNHADVTIAALEVPWEEASRFGTMITQPDCRITGFEEKSDTPSSNLASMGIYIFNTDYLRHHLEIDQQNPDSVNDFGRNVIPQMLNNDGRLYSYRFSGYWRDVGTINSYWDAHMDLLQDNPELNLFDSSWRIYSPNPALPPHFIGPNGRAKNAMITEGCQVNGEIQQTILFNGVKVGKGSRVENSIILSNTVIGENVILCNALVGENVTISDGCQIGLGPKPDEGPAVVIEGGSSQ